MTLAARIGDTPAGITGGGSRMDHPVSQPKRPAFPNYYRPMPPVTGTATGGNRRDADSKAP